MPLGLALMILSLMYIEVTAVDRRQHLGALVLLMVEAATWRLLRHVAHSLVHFRQRQEALGIVKRVPLARDIRV